MKKTLKTSRYQNFVENLRYEIWERDLAALSRFRRVIVESVRIIWQVSKDIWDGELTLRAMSLVYTTLLSLIPLLAISFSVLKGFGVHREIEPFLISYLAPLGEKAEEIGHLLVAFVENTNVAVLGYVGFALLFFAIVSLLQKIELAFNFVWHVTLNRSFTDRIRDYLALVIVGPTLMFAATGVWASILGTNIMEQIGRTRPLGWLLNAMTHALPVFLVIIAFTFIYIFVPNVKVRWPPALIGGIVAGILWNIGGVGFAIFVGNSANYSAIYSSFAAAVFFMIWLYVAWMILLIGGSISFYVQNPTCVSKTRQPSFLSNRIKEKLALAIAVAVGRRFYSDEPPHTAASLTRQLCVPASAINVALAALEAKGLIARGSEEAASFFPAHAWDTVSVGDLITRIRTHGEGSSLNPDDIADASIAEVWERLDVALANTAADVTLRDLSVYGVRT